MFNRKKHTNSLLVLLLACVTIIVASCTKSKGIADDPYAGGKQVFDISFVTRTGDLEEINTNQELQLKVNGLVKYQNHFQFFVNEIEAEVLGFTDSTVNFIVPERASTGSVWIIADGQTFFGPIVKIGGKVSVDESFKVVNGSRMRGGGREGTIFSLLELNNGRFWLAGAFNDFELKGTDEKPIGGIAQISPEGEYITSDVDFGIGVVGASQTIYSVNHFFGSGNESKYIVAGNFSAYNSKRPTRQTINNIALLQYQGKLDTVSTKNIVNPKPEETWKNIDTIPVFNGGVDGTVRKTFVFGEQVYVIGSFQNYKRIYYPNSSYDDKVYDVTRMLQLVRMNKDGSMDSTFHFNPNLGHSERAANGGITDAFMQEDGKLVLVGNFTSFNETLANRIVRLNLDGSVDDSFSSGTGADGDINSVRYHKGTNKIVLTGSFTMYNGQPASGLAMLNADGSLDTNFKPDVLTGGGATFASMLNNGKVLVTGTFTKYGEYVRQGFMILEADGSIAEGYNNTGGFVGMVYDMFEKSTGSGSQVTLVGNISRFNATLPQNILRILISN